MYPVRMKENGRYHLSDEGACIQFQNKGMFKKTNSVIRIKWKTAHMNTYNTFTVPGKWMHFWMNYPFM